MYDLSTMVPSPLGPMMETFSPETMVAAIISGGRAFDFGELALELFAYQLERNVPYREYCLRRGVTCATVHHWRDIPPVPSRAFKLVDLACGPVERVFLTSGTTRGSASRGRHLVPHLALYRTAALTHFAACAIPNDGERLPVIALTPSPALRPDSSLVQMIDWIREEHGTSDSAYFVGQDGLEVDRLHARLEAEALAGRPAYLIGITAAFEELFRHCQRVDRSIRLAHGTLVIDTGGTKGGGKTPATHPLSRRGFLRACWQLLNVPGYHCINEYGMTELCSQFYDNVLRERVAGRLTPRHKVGPPWTRTIVVDPVTLEEVPRGTPGLLRHVDLANAGSVLAIQTEDIGVVVGDGFEVQGRLRGAEPRGCALLLEDIQTANAGTFVSPSGNR